MKQSIYPSLAEKKKQGKKSFAVLIDPDKVSLDASTENSSTH
jgi:putative glycerol-1-phosphate prenyltransferase